MLMCAVMVAVWLAWDDFFALNKTVSVLGVTFVLAVTIGVTAVCSATSGRAPSATGIQQRRWP